jgi:hypothetical protein
MAHTVELRTERGELIRRVVDLGFVEDAARASVGTSCLRFIDPYGETVFNYLQAATLIDELENALTIAAPEATEPLRSVTEMARECAAQGGTYLWFIGD